MPRKHGANLGTCTDYTSNPDGPPSNTAPNKHDYDELVTTYTHLHTSTTVGAALPNSAAAAAAAAAGWGREVARTNGGHTSTFVNDLGHGNLVVTFVIWA